jgi:hypothetical protein
MDPWTKLIREITLRPTADLTARLSQQKVLSKNKANRGVCLLAEDLKNFGR